MMNCFNVYKRYIHILNRILDLAWPKLMKLTLEQQYMLSVLHSQYHACWCTVDSKSKWINKNGIDSEARNIPSPASEVLTLWSQDEICAVFWEMIYHLVLKLLCFDWNIAVGTQNNEISLRWRHNERDGVPNHQPHDCLLNRLFRHRSKKTSKLRVTGLHAGNSPATGVFPTQRASNAENISIWCRHHDVNKKQTSGSISIFPQCRHHYVLDITERKITVRS